MILDGVFNHVGKNSRYFNAGGLYGDDEGAFRNKESKYYSWFHFIHYPDSYDSWWGVSDLPTVDKENPDYQQFIYGKKTASSASGRALALTAGGLTLRTN